MPEMSTQVYWHECPEPVTPWANQEELRLTVHRSRQLRKLRIAPNDFYVALSTQERKLLRQRKDRSQKADRGLLMEPGLTTFGAINALFDHLGKPLMSREEATLAVETVAAEYRAVEAQTQATFAESQHAGASQLTQSMLTFTQSQPPPGGAEATAAAATAQDVKEGPLLHTVRLLLEPRGLKMEVLSKRELQEKHCRIAAADLIPGRRVAMLFDKQRGAMAGVLLDAKVVRHSVRNSMHLLVPVAEPCPWRRRVFGVSAIDAFHCIATFVYHAELDAEVEKNEEGDDEVAAGDGSQHQRSAMDDGERSSTAASDLSSSERDFSSRSENSCENINTNGRARHKPQLRGEGLSAPPVPQRRFGRMLTLQPNILPKLQRPAKSDDDDACVDVNASINVSTGKRPRDEADEVGNGPGTSSSNPSSDEEEDQIVTVSNTRPRATVRATAEDIALLPYPIHRNKALSASALKRLQDPTCNARGAAGVESHGDDDADDQRYAAEAAVKQRRVVTWLEHPEHDGRAREITGQRVSQQCNFLKDETARSMREYGFSCERLEPTGIIKLKFPPPQISSSMTQPIERDDPFTDVPCVAIASKYRDRKHVKHSWTQRLVETERRGKLYHHTQ
jgi:hypothetical protein